MTISGERTRQNFTWVWLPAAVGTTVFLVSAFLGWLLSPNDQMPISDWRVLIVLVIGAPAALIGVIWTLVWIYRVSKREIQVSFESFKKRKHWLIVAQGDHYPRYQGALWTIRGEEVQGFIGLDKTTLEFKATRWWGKAYRLKINLREVKSAGRCDVGVAPCGMRLVYEDGADEYFLFHDEWGPNDLAMQFVKHIKAAQNQLSA
jgi:hypothetical protein